MKYVFLLFLCCSIGTAADLQSLEKSLESSSGSAVLAQEQMKKTTNACTICTKKCTRAYEHQASLCMPYIGDRIEQFPKECRTINNMFNACQSKCPCASG